MGMPLSGKSTVAKALAKKMNCSYSDLDQIIESKLNKTVEQIIRDEGENIFREHEKSFLKNQGHKDNTILSIGGGTISKSTIDFIQRYRYKIWLQASTLELAIRYRNSKTSRPLLYNTSNIHTSLDVILKKREPLYRLCSNIVINTNNKTIDKIVNEAITTIYELN